MKTSELLASAKALIDTPEKWTQGDMAKNAVGDSVDPQEDGATCFCSLGALRKIVVSDQSYDECRRMLRGIMGTHAVIFNDSHTHAEVMEAWDKAIAMAQLKGD